MSSEQIQEIYQAGLAGHQLEKIVSQETDKGESWQVALTPDDQIMDGTTIYSNALGIGDAAPANPSGVYLVSVDGSNESDADLNCSAYIQDEDNSLLDVYVNWFKDGVSVLNQTFTNQDNGTTFSTILFRRIISGTVAMRFVTSSNAKMESVTSSRAMTRKYS